MNCSFLLTFYSQSGWQAQDQISYMHFTNLDVLKFFRDPSFNKSAKD